MGRAGFRPPTIADCIARLDDIRRGHPALRQYPNLESYDADDDDPVVFYGKMDAARDDAVLVAVNLDYRASRECRLRLPLPSLGIGAGEPVRVVELVRGADRSWRGADDPVRLDPAEDSAFLSTVTR